MDYTLENLHRIIDSISPELILTNGRLTQKNIDTWIAEIDNESRSVKVQLMKDIVNIAQERTLEIYVANCQLILIRFANIVTGYLETITRKSKLLVLYEKVLLAINRLLTFIEHHFRKYFDVDANVPDDYYKLAQNELKKNVAISQKFMSNSAIDKSLLEIIYQPLLEFSSSKRKKTISYRDLIYLKELLNELNIYYNSNIETLKTCDVINLVFYLNFNHVLFFNYFISFLCGHVQETTSTAERIENLAVYAKKINQAHYRPGIALFADYPHIKDQILNWITEEIYFLEKKQQLTFSLPPTAVSSEKVEPIYSTMSVAQLGFFVKLLVEAGAINNKNQTELLRSISRVVRTQKNEIISLDSLRNKYYNVENSTADAVKDILFSMINHVKKHK